MDLLHSDFSVLKCRSVLVANRVMQANLTPAFPQLVPIRRENRIPIFGPSCKSLFRSVVRPQRSVRFIQPAPTLRGLFMFFVAVSISMVEPF